MKMLHYFSKMRHYVFKQVMDKKKRIDGGSYFFPKSQARDVTFLTLHYGKIKCHGCVPIVKIERRFKNKNRRNCFIVRVIAEYYGS